MNPDYPHGWTPGLSANNRQLFPGARTFTPNGTPTPLGPHPLPHNGQHFPVQPPQIQPPPVSFFQTQLGFAQPPPNIPAPLIPLSAVEDLEPVFDGPNAFQDPFNRAYVDNEPVVYEGFIPAPGRKEDEDEYPNLPSAFRDNLYRDNDFNSSDEEDARRRFMDDLEEEEELRRLEDKYDSEVDADYSEEDAQYDEGDPDEMELGVDFDDDEERTTARRRKSRASTRGPPRGRGRPSTSGALGSPSTRGKSRGRGAGRAGRPSTRGRGGLRGERSTRGERSARGRKRGKLGSVKGPRGPRPVADPGPEFKNLQRQANDKFIAQEYDAALDFAQQAIQLNPEIFDAYNITSEIYKAMGDEENAIASLIAGAPTKRDAGLWQYIIEQIEALDPEQHPEYTESVKTGAILGCLNWIIELNNSYEARSHKLEIEARLGHSSKCVTLGLKMLKGRKEKGDDPDTEVLKIIAMMGTSSPRQTKLHLDKLIAVFDEAIAVFTQPKRDPFTNEFDWEMINIYLDLLDRKGQYDYAISQLKTLARWKQGRRKEKFWDDEVDDREFDVEDQPRRVHVPKFHVGNEDAHYGSMLPLEIRVKLGLLRLRNKPEDFEEAMRHLELLSPDDHSENALAWDYLDLFRIIADALHGQLRDADALRFYTPLYATNSQELTLMSYIGLHTCYKNLGELEKAKEIIPILQDWPADSYDDLAVLAKFFEDQDMWQDAAQRAERLYRDKYWMKLKRLGFKAYDELRVYHFNERRKARGRYSVRKSTVKRNRKMLQTATAREEGDEDGSGSEGARKELSAIDLGSARPSTGFFRTKRVKPAKAQVFLPFERTYDDESGEPAPAPTRTTIEGTNVPLRAVDQRLFRRKLDILASQHADELTAARKQHREIVSSFKRLEEIWDAAEDGDQFTINEVFSLTRELLEEFSTFDLFYSNKKEALTTYFRRIGSGEIWKESALMVLAVAANKFEDGDTEAELTERPTSPPDTFWDVHFDKWIEAIGRYAMLLAREGDDVQCFATLDITFQSNILVRSKAYTHQLQIVRLACALAADDSIQASIATRWLLKEYAFGTDLFRLYSASNRLTAFYEGFATGAAYKALTRYIKTMDYALLTPDQRAWYNFRDTLRSKGGFKNYVNIEDVDKVKGHDPALFALFGHVIMCSGSYVAALNYYLRAFTITPEDPILNLCIGVAYIQHAMKRLSENRQYQIQQGLAFIYRYYELRTKDNIAIQRQEAEYNVGRMWHALGLFALAIPAYEKCIELSGRVKQEADDRCSDDNWAHEDFATEAAFAIQAIYSITGNEEGAMKVTEQCLVLE